MEGEDAMEPQCGAWLLEDTRTVESKTLNKGL